MTIEKYLKVTYIKTEDSFVTLMRPRIICKDGFRISVQASKGHYCSPRINTDSYESVELGYPNQDELLIKEYAENPDNLKESIYGYVPIGVVSDVINLHGGIDDKKTFVRYQEKDPLYKPNKT